MSDNNYNYCRHKMVELGLIRNLCKSETNRAPGVSLFRFTLGDDSQSFEHDDHQLIPDGDSCELESHSFDTYNIDWVLPYGEMTADEFLQALSENENSSVVQRIYKYLSLRKDGLPFTTYDWMSYFNISHSVANKDVHRAISMGLLEPVGNTVKGELSQFRLTTSLVPSLRIDDLMDEKKGHLQKLYDRFSTDAFIAQDFCEVLDVKKQSISYRLEEFIDRGIIMVGHKSGQNYYRLTVTPKEHPECFQEEIALVVN